MSAPRRTEHGFSMMMGGVNPPENDMPYTHPTPATDSPFNEPTTVSVAKISTHAEIEASRTRTPSLGEGYTSRVPMAKGNDQFPFRK